MKLKVKLYAGLEKSLTAPADGRQVEVAAVEGALVGAVLESLGVSLDQAKLILVNGRHAALDSPLAEGDLLVVFPPVGGG